MEIPFSKGISLGTSEDISQITETVNKAFIGDGNGWTDENFIYNNEPRIDESQVKDQMAKKDSVFILYRCEDGTVGGCLYLEDIGDKKFHLWLMAVNPSKQNQGIGKKLLEASAVYARHNHYKLIELTATASRLDVMAWYERCGFTNTGKIIEFDLSTILPTIKETRINKEVVFVKHL